MLGAAGLRAPAVGNIGVPTVAVVAEGRADALTGPNPKTKRFP